MTCQSYGNVSWKMGKWKAVGIVSALSTNSLPSGMKEFYLMRKR